jgi:hypothetical protein
MAYPLVVTGDDIQIARVTVNILNKQPQIAEN